MRLISYSPQTIKMLEKSSKDRKLKKSVWNSKQSLDEICFVQIKVLWIPSQCFLLVFVQLPLSLRCLIFFVAKKLGFNEIFNFRQFFAKAWNQRRDKIKANHKLNVITSAVPYRIIFYCTLRALELSQSFTAGSEWFLG